MKHLCGEKRLLNRTAVLTKTKKRGGKEKRGKRKTISSKRLHLSNMVLTWEPGHCFTDNVAADRSIRKRLLTQSILLPLKRCRADMTALDAAAGE